MGCGAGFGYALWAIPKSISKRRTRQQFLKACHILKKDSDAKKCLNINSNSEGLHHPSFKSLASAKKIRFFSVAHGAVRISYLNNKANSK
jgi:hypothetical protein